MNWLKNKGKKDKSIGKTAYIHWDVETFTDRCVLRDTEYSHVNITYPSEYINDTFSLVNNNNVDVFEKTLGTAGDSGYGVFDNKYIMYAALDMMSLIYRLKSPEKQVYFIRGFHL